MASISLSRKTKTEIDELKPDDMTYKEFGQVLVNSYRRDNGEVVNVEELVTEIKKQIASQVELAAYRGVTEAIERNT